uniref:Zn-dependent alcohol dehydrogenase n=1 Tax=Hirondellea gigas TaxID=1518452 RepID=A0A6A7GBC8_9CRUS
MAVLLRAKRASVVAKEKMKIEYVDVLKPQGTEVVVKISHAGVCHSDVHAFEHSSVYALYPFPQNPGHEILGTVFSIGPEANGADEELKEGTSVLVYPWISCDECDRCEQGWHNWCLSGKSRTIGGARAGECGYGEYVTVPHPKFLISSAGIEPELAVILPCCGLTSYSAVKESQSSKISCSDGVVVIIGTGGLGLMGIQWAKKISKQTVVGVDISDSALKIATDYGADFVVNSKNTPDVSAFIKSLDIKNKTVEAVIDFVNNVHTHKLANSLCVRGSNLVIVGIAGGAFETNLMMIPLRGVRIQGVFVGSIPDLKELVEICRGGGIRSIVTKRRPLAEIQDALADLQTGKIVGRSILVL